jgi:tetratricopeptide (TPR) repeat protein
MKPQKGRHVSPWILTIAALAGIAGLQTLSDHVSAPFRAEIKRSAATYSEPLVPATPILRLLSFGNPSMVADILWLQTIQYFGSGNPYQNYPSLGKLLDTITTLDPKFEYPYQFGMIVLPYMDQTDSAIMLGERAQKEIPNNGLLTYYLATDYHLGLKDYRKASEYYQKASTQPGAPSAAARLAGVTLAELSDTLSDRLVALEFWKTVYEQATDPDEKERAEAWFRHMEIVYVLEKAALEYKSQSGSFPSSQDQLVKAKLIPRSFKSPINRMLELDPETGRVSFNKLAPSEE